MAMLRRLSNLFRGHNLQREIKDSACRATSPDYTKGLLRRGPKAPTPSIAIHVAFALERSMQRLFGAFPNRGAGLALLILRLAVAAALVTGTRFCPGPATEVLVGLSLAAASAVLISLCTLWVCREPGINALMIAILVAIALLGAGAHSVDARLYGRRRLVVGRPQGKLVGSKTL